MRRCYRAVMGVLADVRLRDAAPADLEAINRIYNHAIATTTATWDEELWTMAKRTAWFEEHGPACPVVVAERGGEVAGFAYLTLMSQKSGWRFTREDTIYLEERFRGEGLGRVLLGALLQRARELGVRLVVASISSDNAASLALHRSLGFEVVGELRNAGYKFGCWQSTTYMSRDLKPT
jgi:phosphinothricin acetyltransferase